MPKPTQPDAEDDKNKKKGQEGHQDESDDDTEGDESEGEGSGDDGKGEEGDDADSDDSADMSSWSPDKVKGYVKNLRKENARYRKDSKASKTELAELRKQVTGMQTSVAKALGLKEGEEMSPEEQAEALSGQLGAQQFKTAVLEAAYNFEVPPQSRDYFEYLVQKEVASLDEGEELDDEALAKIAKKAKVAQGGKTGFSTSISKGAGRRDAEDEDDEDESDDSNPPPSKGMKGLTPERFAEMGTIEKTNLFSKNPQLYDKLMAEARRKKLLSTY
jgi:hypothetical protein